MTRLNQSNKFGARKTWNEHIERWLDSKAESDRATELWLLQKAGVINRLSFQIPYVLSRKPRKTITIDFRYWENGKCVFEDTKGVLTRDWKTKLIWLRQLYGIIVTDPEGNDLMKRKSS